MRELVDLWVSVQTWIFQTFVAPAIFELHLMEWFESAFNATEIVMLGLIQIVVITLVMRTFEKRWPLERRPDNRLMRVDQVYTVLNKLGVIPLAVFVVAYPITQEIEHLVRVMGFAPPRIERIVPWLHDNAFASFLVYFALYDFAAYWLHRAQHKLRWWWALHSLHHSQRQLTVWSDDRNHVLDDLLVNVCLALFAQFVGTQPEDYILILMIGRMVESWSHANIDISFGRFFGKVLVSPRYHRLHHALATPEERHIHDHNFAPVFPIWDILFGTAIYDDKHRPTGVDDAAIDADNDKGWLGQQIRVFGRFFSALLPRFRRA
jgi:sterol desaturase/sphingolipid hydroxylase (fatty acid hydroxylase superfamily)